MNRLALTLAFGFAGYSAFGQAPFTIVRPADGAKIHENIRMLIPRASIVPGGYVGIFIGGKFIEARAADPFETKTPGKYFEYDLDTKAQHIPDGKLTLEAVLYVDYEEKPRIVNRTSVEITVANTADSKIPDKGLVLRYKWTPGTEMVYDVTTRTVTDISDSKKNEMGGKPIEESHPDDKFRIMYAVDNSYPDGSGLVRVQGLPDKHSDSVLVHVSGDDNGVKRRVYANEIQPVYLKVSATGLVDWGSYPFALDIEGTSAEYDSEQLRVVLPLPSLPASPVTIGGAGWTSRFQDEAEVPDEELATTKVLVKKDLARGEFKGVEWEMGHPCAKILNTLALGVDNAESKKLEAKGRAFTGNKQAEVETIWFALDKRQIIKIVRTVTADEQVGVSNGNGMGAAGTSGSPADRGAAPDCVTAMRQCLRPRSRNLLSRDKESERQRSAGRQPAPGNSNTGPRSGSGAPATVLFVRVTHETTFVLEQ